MSIVLQYENSTIQHSDNKGNINHVGVLSSNTQNSPILTDTLPTTSTGSSLGHYHYTDPNTNALQFLNSSGTGSGGHSFYVSTSTSEPVETARFDSNGMTIDKSSAGSPNLVNLPNVTNSGAVFVIFQTPINVPPWNIVGNGNPVQVTQNTANMQTGITYYLQASSPQAGKITTNPDGTGNVNTSDLSSLPQPILAWVNGTGPSVLQTSNLNTELTIVDNTDTMVLSATNLTFNGISIIGQEISNTKSISKLQYAHPINIANSPTIYGTLPSSPPMVPTQNAINTGFNGWYYKNISSSYNNISWANGFQPSSYVVSNLKGFYFTFVSLTTTSKPFVSVYTLPAQAPGGFYNSRRSYVPAIAPATITAGIPYIYYFMYDNDYPTPFKYCHQAVSLSLSGVNPVGAFGPNELLYFMSINTNTISPVGTEELIISESGVIIDDGTGTLIQPFSFNGSDVYSPNSYKTVIQGLGTITPTISNNGTTYIATANFTISNAGLSGVPAGFFIIVQGTNVDRTITFNGASTKIVNTNSGTTNAGQVNFYWTGSQFIPYN